DRRRRRRGARLRRRVQGHHRRQGGRGGHGARGAGRAGPPERAEDVTRLADADWRRVTVHDTHLAFPVAGRACYAPALARFGPGLADAPDRAAPEQNRLRMRMLYYMRRHLVGEIPPDTEWHEVLWLTDEHVDDLRVIGRCEWDNPLDRNQLR